MQILSVRVLGGPNIYSYQPVVRVKLDLGDYDDIPSTAFAGFAERLTALLPGLAEHQCSRGYPGGFVERLYEGTYMAHIFEHVAIELECMAGYNVGFGKTRSSGRPGVYDVIISFGTAAAGVQAAYETDKLLRAVIDGQPFDAKGAAQAVRLAGDNSEMGPSTAAIYQAAKSRGIPVTRIGVTNLLILGYGHRQQRIWATTTGRTNSVAVDLACDKQLTKQVLSEGGIIVPEGVIVTTAEQAIEAINIFGRPVVIKPLRGNQGKGVTLAITDAAKAERAFQFASEYDDEVLVEEHIVGRQYRLCVVNGKMVAAAERIPAYVAGDGQHTVTELVDAVNSSPLRGEGHEKPLTRIKIDAVAVIVLAKQGFTSESVPTKGQIVYIRETSNLSTGGTAVDVTDSVHPLNVVLAERAANLIGLDVAGVDIVAQDITQPILPGTGAVIEINAAPGIRMHHYPSAGKPRDVAGAIVDYLIPDNQRGRIPMVAITGTNGKTTTTRMIGHIWRTAGYRVGMTTTDGIYINTDCIVNGDTTGPASARTVLTDPTVEVAVLETARGGILRGGLAFNQCDVGVVTNITEDHLGQDGIEDLEDLAYVKSLIVEAIRPEGFAILNADDPYVVKLAARSNGEVVYFSTEADNIVVRRHLGIGGKAFFVKDGMLYAACGNLERPISRVADIPLTLGGIAQHNLQNALVAAAVCYCMKVPLTFIRQGLATFDQNPGRLTMVSIGDIRVCVDYGHNPAGYQALINTARRLGATRVVGVIAAPGDRRDDVIVNVGRIAGRGFDKIYIKEDKDRRGRGAGEVAALLRRGVLEAELSPEQVGIILSEPEAVARALADSQPGDLIVIFYETYSTVMSVIQEHRESYEMTAKDKLKKAQYEQLVVAGVQQV